MDLYPPPFPRSYLLANPVIAYVFEVMELVVNWLADFMSKFVCPVVSGSPARDPQPFRLS